MATCLSQYSQSEFKSCMNVALQMIVQRLWCDVKGREHVFRRPTAAFQNLVHLNNRILLYVHRQLHIFHSAFWPDFVVILVTLRVAANGVILIYLSFKRGIWVSNCLLVYICCKVIIHRTEDTCKPERALIK